MFRNDTNSIADILVKIAVAALLWFATSGQAATPPAAAIASAHPEATKAGMEILQAGGNAFDAAVTVAAVLAVVEPYSSGMGGGGFWLIHRARDGHDTMIDGREKAPLSSTRDMYLDKDGEVRKGASLNGPLAAGIPGQPAALVHLASVYGTLPLETLLQPAINLAREGFTVTPHYQRMARMRLETLRASPDAARIFLHQGEVPPLDHVIRQPDLADMLTRLAQEGHQGFYQGDFAKKLVDAVVRAGGIWTLDDLRQYRVVERTPVHARFRNMDIVSAAPPSSGGIALATMLHILDQYSEEELKGVQGIHLTVEAMRLAYADRAQYLGDPDFVRIPRQRLVSPTYARELRTRIQKEQAGVSAVPAQEDTAEGQDTTHYSILDRQGNYVAATLSINYPFGSGHVAEGTGILLNDEMDDFSIKPGVPNAYGLVGAEANAIEPGKRMLSSMSPTFIRSADGIAVVGTPGGSRIITMVLHAILDSARGNGPMSWVSRPRFHHQYLPDLIVHEADAFSADDIKALHSLGHELKELQPYGNMQAVWWDQKSNRVEAASDPRVEGRSMVAPVPPVTE